MIAFIQAIDGFLGFLTKTEIFLRPVISSAKNQPSPYGLDQMQSWRQERLVDAAEELLPFAEAIAFQKCQWMKPEDAEDIAVQAFREIQRQYAEIPSEGDFRARLVACTKYRVLDWIEKTAPSRKHVQNAEDISDLEYKALYYDADPATVFAYENMLREDDRATAREILNGLDPEARQLLFERLVLVLLR